MEKAADTDRVVHAGNLVNSCRSVTLVTRCSQLSVIIQMQLFSHIWVCISIDDCRFSILYHMSPMQGKAWRCAKLGVVGVSYCCVPTGQKSRQSRMLYRSATNVDPFQDYLLLNLS